MAGKGRVRTGLASMQCIRQSRLAHCRRVSRHSTSIARNWRQATANGLRRRACRACRGTGSTPIKLGESVRYRGRSLSPPGMALGSGVGGASAAATRAARLSRSGSSRGSRHEKDATRAGKLGAETILDSVSERLSRLVSCTPPFAAQAENEFARCELVFRH